MELIVPEYQALNIELKIGYVCNHDNKLYLIVDIEELEDDQMISLYSPWINRVSKHFASDPRFQTLPEHTIPWYKGVTMFAINQWNQYA